MDPTHFTAAPNAALSGASLNEDAFYNAHGFERWHWFTALIRRLLSWRPGEVQHVQGPPNRIDLVHAR